jgi:hypothetical protein
MSETPNSELDKLRRLRLQERVERFNELAEELQLSEDDTRMYNTATIEAADAAITSLRIMKSRANAGSDKPVPKPAFFHPADKRGNAKVQPEKPSEEPVTPARRAFNMAQLADARYEPDCPQDLEASDNTILRLYTYTDPLDHRTVRSNDDGWKI